MRSKTWEFGRWMDIPPSSHELLVIPIWEKVTWEICSANLISWLVETHDLFHEQEHSFFSQFIEPEDRGAIWLKKSFDLRATTTTITTRRTRLETYRVANMVSCANPFTDFSEIATLNTCYERVLSNKIHRHESLSWHWQHSRHIATFSCPFDWLSFSVHKSLSPKSHTDSEKSTLGSIFHAIRRLAFWLVCPRECKCHTPS